LHLDNFFIYGLSIFVVFEVIVITGGSKVEGTFDAIGKILHSRIDKYFFRKRFFWILEQSYLRFHP
jgi:hypothetical protein